MAEYGAPRKRISRAQKALPNRYRLFETGELTIDDLDEEEILKGRLKNRNGTFTGRPPAVVPTVFIQAILREQQRLIGEKLRSEIPTAIKALHEVAEWGGGKGGMARAAAAKTLLEYTIGKPMESMSLSVKSDDSAVERAPWEDLLPRVFHVVEREQKEITDGSDA